MVYQQVANLTNDKWVGPLYRTKHGKVNKPGAMTSSENFIFDSRKQNFANIIHVQCTIVIPLSFSPSFILFILFIRFWIPKLSVVNMWIFVSKTSFDKDCPCIWKAFKKYSWYVSHNSIFETCSYYIIRTSCVSNLSHTIRRGPFSERIVYHRGETRSYFYTLWIPQGTRWQIRKT
jgi:hypothetical protein